MSNADPFAEDEMLPDGVSLLLPSQRAAVAARRSAPPTSAFAALLRASVPEDGDPPVGLVEDQMPSPTSFRGSDEQPREPLPPELSLLTPEQQVEVRARRAAGGAR